MANPKHVEILKQGVEVWNKWRKDNPNIKLDLRGTDLSAKFLNNINLSGTDLSETNMYEASLAWSNFDGANLINSNLSEANFSLASFIGANVSGANLLLANLFMANLEGSNFSKADLTGANLSITSVKNCNFNGSIFGSTTLSYINLGHVKNLDKARHRQSSSMGIDTIIKSKGKIPASFLRGCGVPEDFIKLIPSLIAAAPFQFYKCFISHSTKNHLFCDRLYADLQSKGVRCWYFPEDARWGRSVWGEIDKPIKIYDKLILVCSKQSLNSPAVLRELERALQREDAEGKHVLFPIRIDNYLLGKNGWDHPRKADVVAKVAGDFRNWKDPIAYKKALDRLLRDLKASEE